MAVSHHAAPATIAALASAAGRAGVAVIRVSGPRVPAIAQAVLGRRPPPRRALAAAFADAIGTPIDHGLALYFPAPASFTGEHVLELHGHGSPVLVDRLLARLGELGARAAGPGEFSERAFGNGKITLDQAEAVADAINAGSAAAASAAVRSLEGAFGQAIEAIGQRLTRLRVVAEGSIDFADEEDVEGLERRPIEAEIGAIEAEIGEVIANAERGAALGEGRRLVLAGRPNVGKSSLMNALAGRDAAIVTDVPGTTRDVLERDLVFDGLPVRVMDTAGLRASANAIEAEGVRRARAALARADRALFIIDARYGLTAADRDDLHALPHGLPVTVVANKVDLCAPAPRPDSIAGYPALWLSATAGTGLDVLAAHVAAAAGLEAGTTPPFAARRRHVQALSAAAAALAAGRARFAVDGAGELLAEELRVAHNHLGQITGAVTSDALLGEIFATFCIGK